MRITLLYLWLMLALIASLATLTSCSEKNVKEKLPATYFDATFGVSKEVVTNGFTKHGMRVGKVEESMVQFFPAAGDSISYEGQAWDRVSAGFFKGKFIVIDFLRIHENDSVAAEDYNRILADLKGKYEMKEIPQENMPDSAVLKCAGYNAGKRAMSFTLRKGQSVDNEPRWYCTLEICEPQIADERPGPVKVIERLVKTK